MKRLNRIWGVSLMLTPFFLSAQVPEGGIQLNATSGTTWQKLGKCDITEVAVDGQDFDTALEVAVGTGLNNTWDAQVKFPSVAGIEEGDVILVAFWARTTYSEEETGEGFLNVTVELNQDPYTKEIYHAMSIGNEWKEYYARTVVSNSRTTAQVSYLFHMGYESQTIEVARVRFLNYQQSLELEDLPVTETTYVGQDPDAAWRTPAAERIAEHRMGPMELTVVDGQGQPIPGAQVKVAMERHAFGFGTAVVASRILNDQTYRDTLFSMFNEAVFENDLKWPPFENIGRRNTIKPALDSLDAHGFETRGHNIIWPSWQHMPSSIESLMDKPEHLRAAIDRHFDEVVEFTKGRLNDWDVMNEPYTNHVVQDILGDEVMANWYTRPLRIDRGVKLYMNDYSILSGGGKNTAKQDYYYQLIQDIEAQGGTIHGIGMQGHFATELTPIERLYEIVDRFAQLGKDIKVTEFDIATDQRKVQADYTRDFMTILFSHPSVKAILGWGFVASSHWKPDAALYDADWTIRPNGLMWKKMIYEEWWTPEQTGQSDAGGKFGFEGYLGTYSYEITAGDSTRTGTFILDHSHASGLTDSLVISMDEGVVEELLIHPSEEGFMCEGEEISLAVPHMEGFSYAWTLNGETIAADTSQISATQGGLYRVSAQRGDFVLEALPYELELRNAPRVEIGLDGESSFCPGEKRQLSVLVGGEGQVEWYRGIQRVQWGGESFETEQSGLYFATLTSGGCTSRSNELTLEALPGTDPACTVSVETRGLEASRVYPNPCEGRLMVELPCAIRGGELRLYDASGQLRKQQALEEGSQLHELHIPSPGLYLLRIRSGQDEFTQRVISH